VNSANSSIKFLADPLLVIELGGRIASGACGSLLADLGADVVVIEPAHHTDWGKWSDRTSAVRGKRTITASPDNRALIRNLLNEADVIITCSDEEPDHSPASSENAVVCDITAFGSFGPLSGKTTSEPLLQAISGAAWITGQRERSPVLASVPALDMEAGVYAAAAIMAALRYRGIAGVGQRVEVAIFDVAVNALAAFLPLPLTGSPASRNGNRHATLSPWNTYATTDGWVMVCAPTNAQWNKLCTAMNRPELRSQKDYASPTARMINADAIDLEVSRWTRTVTAVDCEQILTELGIPCGPIVPLAHLDAEPNLAHRNMVKKAWDEQAETERLIPGNVFDAAGGNSPTVIPAPDSGVSWARQRSTRPHHTQVKRPEPRSLHTASSREEGPLTGIRVVEIGMNTVGPLAGRQLGALGAEVIKVEPPTGDSNRSNAPLREDGQSYIFAISNTDKHGIVLDLRKDDDRNVLLDILATTDVLIENLKPGSLGRLGLDPSAMTERFPQLIYCSMNGFGHNSAYPGRPALDTVIQAMSGVLDATREADVPTKLGISLSDQLGGQFGLTAVLAALVARDQTGIGRTIDIAMHDATAWATQTLWNAAHTSRRDQVQLVSAHDGYVAVEGNDSAPNIKIALEITREEPELTRDGLVDRLNTGRRHCAAPVLTLEEVIDHEHTRIRELLIERTTSDGSTWRVIETPMRFSRTHASVRSVMPALGYRNDELKQTLARRPLARS
jgi:crotonobetainyl-CoA:carnitine CoA-transferase CaiB-like acyl-CoA transferase